MPNATTTDRLTLTEQLQLVADDFPVLYSCVSHSSLSAYTHTYQNWEGHAASQASEVLNAILEILAGSGNVMLVNIDHVDQYIDDVAFSTTHADDAPVPDCLAVALINNVTNHVSDVVSQAMAIVIHGDICYIQECDSQPLPDGAIAFVVLH